MDYTTKMNTITFNENNVDMNDSATSDTSFSIKSISLFTDFRYFIGSVFGTVRRESPVLFWIGMSCFLLALGCLPGLIIDDRTLMGVSVWLKPLKFSISTAIYILTVGYLITLYPYSKRKKRIINGITAWTLLFELGIIVYQGAMGVKSHYNMSSALDALLFAAMGILIGINVLIMVLFLFDTLRLKLKTDKSVQWAIVIGWVVVLVGSWVGGQMINQVAHNVGVADGGAGLPFLNWSTIAGDLRVAHFFGLHGIQIIPLFALWLSKNWKAPGKKQIIAVTIFGLIYAAWIGYTFFQAKHGIALLSV